MCWLSFKRTDAERTIARWRMRFGSLRRRSSTRCGIRLTFYRHIGQEGRGWNEEQRAGDGLADVKQAIVIAGRVSDEHVGQHLFDAMRRPSVTDEIRAE